MAGWNCEQAVTRVFVTWPPGADVDHQTRLNVTQYCSDELDKKGQGDQYRYNDFLIGVSQENPGDHMYLAGVIARAREMAGCEVQVWVAVTIIPRPTMPEILGVTGNTELCEPMVIGENDDGEV